MIPFAAKNLRASPASEVVERLVVESLPFRADPDDHRSVSTACQVVESFSKACRAGLCH